MMAMAIRSPYSAVILIFIVGLTSTVSGQSVGYCARRGCCPGRDDNCNVPFFDTLCYCDEFCRRTNSDCCPDYYGSLCHLPEATTPTSSGDSCSFQGRSYAIGESVKDNCKTCVCEVVGMFGGLEFQCSQDTCAIEIPKVQEINLEKNGWTARNYSDFWGKTLRDARKYYTGTLEPPATVAGQYEVNIDNIESLPKEFDVRDKWGAYIGGIQDQGSCGSSWAASTIALASDRMAIQSRGLNINRLSMQHLLSCNNQNQQGCNGGHTDRAYFFLRRNGVVTEECYPLESGQSEATEMATLPCRLGRYHSNPCPNRGVTSELQKSTPSYRIGSNQEEIMDEILRNGPVQATFIVKEDFFSYGSGVYRYSGAGDTSESETGFHSVRIMGWGVDRDTGSPYWLCANSWGTEWGEDGFFRIYRGTNECEIESFVVGVWGQVDAAMNI